MSEPTPAMTAARCGCTAEQVDYDPQLGYHILHCDRHSEATVGMLVEALRIAEKDLARQPQSFGYAFLSLNQVRAALRRLEKKS